MQDSLAVNIAEAARRLGISARTVATLVARRELASRRIGRRRIIPVHALEEFLRKDHGTDLCTQTNPGQHPNSKGATKCR
jgi:excisionase family DNA binding protein